MSRIRFIIIIWVVCLGLVYSLAYAKVGRLKVEVEPETMVFIDGAAASPKPSKKVEIVVDAGPHQVSAEANGYTFEVINAEVEPEKTTTVYLSLVRDGQNRDAMASVAAGAYDIGMDAEKLKWICKGMNCEKEYLLAQPAYSAKINTFSIDKYEVTNRQYKKFVQATKRAAPKGWRGEDYPAEKDDYPVVNVTWQDAAGYCKWAGKRLPTEIEWEIAARGGKKLLYPWGQKYRSGLANVNEETYDFATVTGRYEKGKSHLDCYDMLGNVWEWTGSSPSLYPGAKAKIDPKDADKKILRGGSFRDADYMATTAFRRIAAPNESYDNIGFRCAK